MPLKYPPRRELSSWMCDYAWSTYLEGYLILLWQMPRIRYNQLLNLLKECIEDPAAESFYTDEDDMVPWPQKVGTNIHTPFDKKD